MQTSRLCKDSAGQYCSRAHTKSLPRALAAMEACRVSHLEDFDWEGYLDAGSNYDLDVILHMSYRELEVKLKIRHVHHIKIIVAIGVQVAIPDEIFQMTPPDLRLDKGCKPVSPITLYCFRKVTASGHFSKQHTHLYHHRLASACCTVSHILYGTM